jgi:hypothetical protein
MNCDLVLFSNNGSNVLVSVDESGAYAFPRFSIRRGSRPAELVTDWYRSNLSIDIYCLFVNLDESSEGFYAASRTLTDNAFCTEDKWKWLPVTLAEKKRGLQYPLQAIHARFERYKRGLETDVFGHYDWLNQFARWFQTVDAAPVLHLQHLNCGPFFCLLRIQTESAAYWFKAVGCDNVREHPATLYLHQYFSEFVPAVLASRPEWNGWLARHVDGLLLGDMTDSKPWSQAFRRIAELQIRSMDHVDRLLEGGAVPWTIGDMRERLGEFFDGTPALMERQPKEPPARLSNAELRSLHERMTTICYEMESLRIPDTLMHGDLNPWNIIVSESGPIFLDWSEVYVGNPFLCAELLLRYFRNQFGDEGPAIDGLREAFNTPWRALLRDEMISRAWAFAGCLAPLLTALYLPDVDAHNVSTTERQDAFQRSLIRTIKRASDSLEIAVCQ